MINNIRKNIKNNGMDRIFRTSLHIIFIIAFFLLIPGSKTVYGGNAQYIILFMADGWGQKTIEATNSYTGSTPSYQITTDDAEPDTWTEHWMSTVPSGSSYDPAQAWSDFDYVKTDYGDSASCATGINSGFKTLNGRINVNGSGTQAFTTIGEIARQNGMGVGAVSSVEISHATPGAWIAHNSDRGNFYAIADEGLFGDPNTTGTVGTDYKYGGGWGPTMPPVDVLIGASNSTYVHGNIVDKLIDESSWPGTHVLVQQHTGLNSLPDGGDALMAQADILETTKLAGLFSHIYRNADNSGDDPEVPTLAESTLAALKVLNKNPNGFVLMVEGGAIDIAAHANEMNKVIGEVIDFDNAIEAVNNWVADPSNGSNWSNTLFMVTTDHDCGYLTAGKGIFPNDPVTGNNIPIGTVTSTTITNENVVTGSGGRRASWEDVENVDEVLYSQSGSATVFSGQFANNPPLLAGSLVLEFTIGTDVYLATDDGNGQFIHSEIATSFIDYSTGAINVSFNNAPDNASDIMLLHSGVIDFSETVYWYWNVGTHTKALVPLYAKGTGSELIGTYESGDDDVRGPYIDNTDVFTVMDTAILNQTCISTGYLSLIPGQSLYGDEIDITSLLLAYNATNINFEVYEAVCPGQINESVITKQDTWNYNDANGGDIGTTTWMNTGFDDGGWSSGMGPFGYGESYINTTVGVSGNQSSAYFRKTFDICDPNSVTSLSMNVTHDDGLVVYINGVKVADLFLVDPNPPTGSPCNNSSDPPLWNGGACNHESQNSYDTYNLDAYIGNLVSGTNVIAVGLYNVGPGSSDFVFDGELIVSHDLIENSLHSEGYQLSQTVDSSGWQDGVKNIRVTAEDAVCTDTLTPANGTFTFNKTSPNSDSLIVSDNIPVASQDPLEGALDLVMQRFQVDTDLDGTKGDGSILLSALSISDEGTTTNIANAAVYISLNDSTTDLPAGAVKIGETGQWNGQAQLVTLDQGTVPERTVSEGTPKYIYIVYDIASGNVGETVQSSVSTLFAADPDLSSGNVGNSNELTIQTCVPTGSLAIQTGQTLYGRNEIDLTSIVTSPNASNVTYTVTEVANCDVNPAGTYIEAENYTGIIPTEDTGTYSLETSVPVFFGDGYMVPSGSTSQSPSNCQTDPVTKMGLEYQVNFPTTGVYYVWVRGHSTLNSPPNNWGDSIFIGVDGDCSGALIDYVRSGWVWQDNLRSGSGIKTITVDTPGIHTFNIWIRENNYFVDGIYISQDSATDPTDQSYGTVIDPTACFSPIWTGDENEAQTVDTSDASTWKNGLKKLQVTGEDATCHSPLTAANDTFTYSSNDLPISSIIYPSHQDVINDSYSDPLTISGSASDEQSVNHIEISINGGPWQTVYCPTCPAPAISPPDPWTFSWTLPQNGLYTIRSRAFDNDGAAEIPGPGITVDVQRGAPEVISTDPADTAALVPTDSPVIIDWDKNVDCGTVDTSSVTIVPAPATSWSDSCSGSQAIFTPVGQTELTTYTVTVASTITDSSGNPMAGNYVFSYTTGETTDPTSSITDPSDGQKLNTSSADPYLITGTAGDTEGTVTGIEISIDGGAWGPVNTCIDCGTASATWEHSWILPAGEDGTIPHTIATRATDDSGNVQDPATSTITVYVDKISPSVDPAFLFPVDDQTQVTEAELASEKIDIVWNENMDCSTINTVTVLLDGIANNPAWERYGCGGNAAEFRFLTPAPAEFREYTVTVTTAVTNHPALGSDPMSDPFVFSFTTNDKPTLTITEPDGTGDTIKAGHAIPFNITYGLEDRDDAVSVDFWRDTDQDKSGGTLIATCNAAPAGSTCEWNVPAGLTPDDYFIYGVVTDISGTYSEVSAGALTVTPPNVPPTLIFTEPDGVDDTVLLGDTYSIGYTLNDPDNTVTAKLYVDNDQDDSSGLVEIQGCEAVPETNTTCDWTTTTAGTFYIYGIVDDGDGSGDITVYSQFTVTVNSADDSTTFSITEPRGNDDAIKPGGSFDIAYDLSDDDDVVTAEFYYDDDTNDLNGVLGSIAECSAAPEGQTTCTWTATGGLAESAYYVYGRAWDPRDGSWKVDYSDKLEVDATDPSSTITDPQDQDTLNSSSPDPYIISGTAGDSINVAGIEVSTDSGTNWSPAACNGCPGKNVTWTYSWDYDLDGAYTIMSRATDTAGNVESTYTINVTVDRAPPTLDTTVPSNSDVGIDLNNTVTINWNEPIKCATVNTTNVTINNGAALAAPTCSGSQAVFPVSGQSNGIAYIISLTSSVTDEAGNPMAPDSFSYTTNFLPDLSISKPDGDGTEPPILYNSAYLITYQLYDQDDTGLTVDFYYDTDDQGHDGQPIGGDCSGALESPIQGQNMTCTWNTGALVGTYHVYGVTSDDSGSGACETRTWTGAQSSDVTDSANWLEGSAPQEGDDVIFNSTANNADWQGLNIAINSLTITSGYSGTLTISEALTVWGDVTINGGTVIQDQAITTIGDSGGSCSGGGTLVRKYSVGSVTIDQQDPDYPSSTITDPADGATLNASAPDTYTISGSASDIGGTVTGVEVSTDGGSSWNPVPVENCTGCGTANATWTYSWDLTAAGNGIFTIQSRATDSSGNVETPAAGNTVTVDRTIPTSTITDPADGATLNSASPDPYTISGSASDIGGTVTGVEVSTDGGSSWNPVLEENCTGCGTANATWTYSWNLTAAGNGNFTIQSRATDSASNVETPSAGNTVTVDRDSLTSTILNPADGVTLNSSAANPYTIDGTADDNVAVTGIEVSTDGGSSWNPVPVENCTGCGTANATWTYNWNLDLAGDGVFTIQSRATDSANNVETPSAGNTVTVDRTAPMVNTTIPANGATGVIPNIGITITWDENDLDCLTVTTGAGGSVSVDKGDVSLSTCSGNVAQFTTANQDSATLHTLTISSAVMDNAGNAMTPYQFSFMTLDVDDPGSTISAPTAGAKLTAGDFSYAITGAATDNVAVTGIEVSTNGTNWFPAACTGCPGTPVTWTYNWTFPGDGPYTIESRATDSTGNVEEPLPGVAVTVDSTEPETTIDSNPADPTMSTTADFTFSGTDTGGTGVASFECNLDSGGWGACTSPQNFVSLGDGSHTFAVRAIDNAGNTDSTPDSFTWVVDTGEPETSIDSNPADPTTSTTADFTFSGTDVGGSGVASFQCNLDSGGWGACTSPQNFVSLGDGSHTFEVRAIDNAGNTDSTQASFTWVIDTGEPETTIDSNPADPTASTTANFTFSGTDNGGSGVASFECNLDSGGWGACTSPQNFVSLGDGSHTFAVRAIDNSGVTDSTPASFTWVVDTTEPETTIDSNPADPTMSTTADFTFSGTDTGGSGVASFECNLDSGGWGACTSPQNFVSLGDGSHTFAVRAIDNAGNTDSTADSFAWVVDTTEPDTAIDSNPDDPSASADAAFTFSGTDIGGSGVASFECNLDSAGWGTCTSPQNFISLSEGSHTFEVRAKDIAGNTDGSAASYTWDIDTGEPETTIDSNPADPTTSTTADFTFSGTDTGGSGVASFECNFDSGGWGACTSPQNFVSLGDGPHTFAVRAIDDAGNTDSTPDSFTWVVDTTEPETTIDSNPADPTTSTTADFTFSGTDVGGSGVASFECNLDSGGWGACTSPQNFIGLGDGSHTFEVRAIDNSGNTDSTPDSFTWVVDTTEPETTIDSNPADPTTSTTADFTFSGTDASGSGVASFECNFDSGGWGACTSPQNFIGLGDGSHTFEVRAIDNSGNTDSTPDSFTWVVDTTEPETTIDSNPADPTTSTTANFTFSGTDVGGSGVASFECNFDSGGWGACTSPQNFVSLGDGSHTFEVRAIDNAGNTDSTAGSYTWDIDTGEPETTINSNPADPTTNTTADFTFSGTDTGGSGVASFECNLDSGGWGACISPQNFVSLGDGSHTFEVRAIDNAGNTDSTQAIYTWVVDTAGPETSIDSNPADPTMSTTANFTFSGTDAGGSGVASYQCRLDGGSYSDCSAGSKSYTSLGDGLHTFYVKAIDAAGNEDSSPASYSWTVDTTSPTVDEANTSPQDGEINVTINELVTITWSENIECSTVNTTNITMSSGGWSRLACGGNTAFFTTSGQSPSSPYTVTVTTNVQDKAGNAMAADHEISYTTAP